MENTYGAIFGKYKTALAPTVKGQRQLKKIGYIRFAEEFNRASRIKLCHMTFIRVASGESRLNVRTWELIRDLAAPGTWVRDMAEELLSVGK